jgi:hypothetical protein
VAFLRQLDPCLGLLRCDVHCVFSSVQSLRDVRPKEGARAGCRCDKCPRSPVFP